jgi:hypothetical protein
MASEIGTIQKASSVASSALAFVQAQIREATMAFEQMHPNPIIQRNMTEARDLRAAYVRQLFARIKAAGRSKVSDAAQHVRDMETPATVRSA